MSRSIIPGDDESHCWICSHYGRLPEAIEDDRIRPGLTDMPLQTHHIFGGPLREVSEHYGLKVHLCVYHHTAGTDAVHNNRTWDRILKQEAQKAFEERYGHAQFMQVVGRNYLRGVREGGYQHRTRGEADRPGYGGHGHESEALFHRGHADPRALEEAAGRGGHRREHIMIEWCVSDCGQKTCIHNKLNRRTSEGIDVFMRDNTRRGCLGYKHAEQPKKAAKKPAKTGTAAKTRRSEK